MKNLLKTFIILAVVFSFSVNESKAQMSAGGGVWYGTNINTVGFSVNGKYQFDESWSADPAFTYFLKKDGLTWMSLDLDANYIITEIDNVGSLYGIGGLNVTFFNFKIDYNFEEYTIQTKSATVYDPYGSINGTSISGSNFGVNLGIGLKIPVGESMAVAPEIRYTIIDGGYLRIGAKFMFGF